MTRVLLAFLASRIVLMLTITLIPPAEPWRGTESSPLGWRVSATFERSWLHHGNVLLDAWARTDATYYLQIAGMGYGRPQSLHAVKEGFFPGYPWLIGTLGGAFERWWPVGEDPDVRATWYLVSGLLVSNAAAVLALWLLVILGAETVGRSAAVRGAIALAVLPFGFLLSTLHSEALFLCLILAASLAARRGAALGAGVLGFGAACTRVLGVTAGLPLLWTLMRRPVSGRERWSATLALLLVPLGLLVVLWVFGQRTGDPFIYFKVQEGYGHAGFPTWEGVLDLFRPSHGVLTEWQWEREVFQAVWLVVLCGLVGVQVFLSSRGRMPWEWTAWTLPLFLLPLLAGSILSLPRYSLVLFPLWLSAGWLLPSGRAGWILLVLALVGQAVLFRWWEAHIPLII